MILDPAGPELDEILEGEPFQIVFTGDYTNISIDLIDFPDTVYVENNKVYGQMNFLFDLPIDSLKYRMGLGYGKVSNFNDLPIGADIYSYLPPVGRIRTFNLIVTVTYMDTEGTGMEQTDVIPYTLPVHINYDLYRNKFIEVLNASSNL